ncbi:MAG: LruC domain-containing protein [Pedobacter sp.]|nr:MAG: LruC domain-containing protein [Pedobacter sp.]
MKKSIPFFGLIFLVAFSLSSCKKNSSKDPVPNDGTDVPQSFNYATTKEINISMRLLSNNDKPIQGAILNISDPDDPNRVFLRAVSDATGYVNAEITIPSYLDTLVISPNYIGLLNNALATVKGKSTLNAIIGGANMASGDIIPEKIIPANNPGNEILGVKGLSATNVGARGVLGVTYAYPAPYTSSSDAIVNTSNYPSALGRPKFLESTSDVIETGLLNYVNASLPEGKPLTSTHPSYLTATGSNLVITQTSDVWITFVSEGAGFLNTLAYYSYDTDNPPTSPTSGTLLGGVDKITMIFPNASGYQSSGGLLSGDKVKLGRFNAGTTIAFVLFQNAWSSTGVNTSATKFYSESKFNPELSSTKKKHSVLLHDNIHNLFLLGFEDTNREGSADNDFNDLVIYATSNPVTGISNSGVAPIDKGGDRDGDGIIDQLDEFPDDISKAYITYSPSETGWSTLAFEDNWPLKGDYDVNDLVVNYRYTFIKNAKNEGVELTGEYQPLAAGANYKNGFGVQLPVAASTVSSVSGQRLQSGYIQQAANGVEAGQSKAVIIPFDNHELLLKNPDGSFLVNTTPEKAKVTPAKATVLVKFSSPVSMADLGSAPFNPFLISNLRRGYEIHLPNNIPTDKATASLFGTGDDKSSPASGRYYLDKSNSPWALSFSDAFSYPIETRPITDAYLHFQEWVNSGGSSFRDWYVNPASGYRNTNYIYTK